MRKTFLTAAVAAAVLGGFFSAPASAGVTVWAGSIILTAVQGCAAYNLNSGLIFDSMFRPKLNTGEPNSALSIIFPLHSAELLMATNSTSQMRGKTAYTATGMTIAATPLNTSGFTTFTIAPVTITSTTPQILIKGTITNFDGLTGCTVTIIGSYALYGPVG